MKPAMTAVLAIGAGVVGLVILHGVLAGQANNDALNSALGGYFAPLATDGTTDNSVPVPGNSGAATGQGAANAVSNFTVPTWDTSAIPAGIDPTGWNAAQVGAAAIAAGNLPPNGAAT